MTWVAATDIPDAEVEVSSGLVQGLLSSQFPTLADLEISELTNGWDNVMFRLGDELCVRVPRREMSARLVEHEAQWLPVLAPQLPLPIPAPLHLGQPEGEFPWHWTIVPYFEGKAVGQTPFANSTAAARALGGFLGSLHTPAPPGAPDNPYRGGPLRDRDEITLRRMRVVDDLIDVDKVAAGWKQAMETPPWTGPPVWIHGDLHPLNLIQNNGELAAVIDFGDITAGDPATDFLAAWSLFDPEARAVFRNAAHSDLRPIDDDLWERGRGWAITHSLAVLEHSANSPDLRAVALRALTAATFDR